jgi:hypothetical protein
MDESDIALRAYQLWDAAGRPEGRSEEFYFAAEEELRLLIEQKTSPEADCSPSNDCIEKEAGEHNAETR